MNNRILSSLTITINVFLSTCIFGQNVGINTPTPVGKLHVKGSENVPQLIIDADTIQYNNNPLIKLRKSTGADLLWIHSDDSTNVFVGLKSGKANLANTAGINNTFMGSRTGYSNTTGSENTGIGGTSLYTNTTGTRNTATGFGALYSNISGTYNTASGYKALYSNTSAGHNTASGYNALYSNTTGELNTAFGARALEANSSGYSNTAHGTSALQSNTIGFENTAMGELSLYSNTSGSKNTSNGNSALALNTSASENTAIGHRALYTQSYNNSGNTWVSANVAVGFETLYSNQPTNTGNGYRNTAVGYAALRTNTTGRHNTAVGYRAIYSNTSGFVNTAIGVEALFSNTTGNYNVSIGNVTLNANVSGSFNTAVGGSALSANTTGGHNTGVGDGALISLVGGSYNCALGSNSGTAIGSPNVANTISIGNDGYANAASNQAFIGNLSTAWTGGQTNWFTYASDARVKNNVSEDVKGLDFIQLLRPVTYHLNITAMREITHNEPTEDYPGKYDVEKIKQSGFLAQEVEQAAIASGYDFSGITIPKTETELYTMSYAQFVVPLVKAVQEQQAMIDDLKKINAALIVRLEALEKKNH